MHRAVVCVTVLSMLAVVPAVAEPEQGWFVGASVGQSFSETDFSKVTGDNLKLDDEDFAWRVFGGLRPSKYMSVELGYRDLGKIEGQSGGTVLRSETQAVDLVGVGMFPIGPFDVFGKIGVAAWDSDSAVDDVSVSTDDIDALYGIGAAFRLGRIGIRLEYEVIDSGVPEELSMLSVGATFTF